jgi:hypothetical protein
MDMAIQKAQEEKKEKKESMIIMTNDKEKLRAYQMRMLALSDQVSGINHAYREGFRKGKKKGLKESLKENRFEDDVERYTWLAAEKERYSNEEIAYIMSISLKRLQKIIQAQ